MKKKIKTSDDILKEHIKKHPTIDYEQQKRFAKEHLPQPIDQDLLEETLKKAHYDDLYYIIKGALSTLEMDSGDSASDGYGSPTIYAKLLVIKKIME